MSDWGSTNRVPALVALTGGLTVEGDLHLLTRPAYPPGPEEYDLGLWHGLGAFLVFGAAMAAAMKAKEEPAAAPA